MSRLGLVANKLSLLSKIDLSSYLLVHFQPFFISYNCRSMFTLVIHSNVYHIFDNCKSMLTLTLHYCLVYQLLKFGRMEEVSTNGGCKLFIFRGFRKIDFKLICFQFFNLV
jgi:hypothetical protein